MEPLEILFAGVVGIFSGSLVLLGLYLLQFKFPKLFSLNPFHFLGSLVFTDSSGIYLLGSLTCWMVSGILGIAYGYAYSFEESFIRTTIFLIVIQYVLFGLLIGFIGNFHPAVKAKELSKPRYFWITDNKLNGMLFCVANLSFGVITYLGYAI